MGKAVTKIRPQPNFDLQEPGMYKVLYLNDDQTAMDFVIETLVTVFNHSETIAKDITQKVHNEGSSVVAILPYEIAEQKGVEVTQLARTAGYPLQIKLEPVD